MLDRFIAGGAIVSTLAAGGTAWAADIPGGNTTKAVLAYDKPTAGRLETAGDVDWYRVDLVAGTSYAFAMRVSGPAGDNRNTGSVILRDANGKPLGGGYASTGGSGGAVGGLDFRPAKSGVYFLAVQGDRPGGYTVTYHTDTTAVPPTEAILTLGQARQGSFFFSGDADVYELSLERGVVYRIDLKPSTARGNWSVLTFQGKTVADSHARALAPASGSPRNWYRASYTGTFFVKAYANDGPLGTYALTVSEVPGAPPFDPAAGPTAGDDVLLLGDGPETVDALAGNDTLDGFPGDDVLHGGPGSDALLGGIGDDFLDGGPGADFLQGATDDDRISGGPLTGDPFDEAWGGPGRDVFEASVETIHDFKVGDDRIDLSMVDADATKPGRQAFVFVGAKVPTHPGEVGFRKAPTGTSTLLLGFTGKVATADLRITLDGAIDLIAARDLIL